MHQFMIPTTLAYSRSAHRLRFAIDRFLAGKLTPMQLQSWCFAHFEQPKGDEQERLFWQLTMLNLDIFHRCDFPRAALAQGLAELVSAIDTTGLPCATSLTMSECGHELTRMTHRNGDTADGQVVIALGHRICP